MSAPQETTRVGKPKRQIKSPNKFADQQFEINNKRQNKADNTQAGKDLLNLAQVTEVEKSPTFIGFA